MSLSESVYNSQPSSLQLPYQIKQLFWANLLANNAVKLSFSIRALGSNLSSKFLVVLTNIREQVSKKDDRTFSIYNNLILESEISVTVANKPFLEKNFIQSNLKSRFIINPKIKIMTVILQLCYCTAFKNLIILQQPIINGLPIVVLFGLKKSWFSF